MQVVLDKLGRIPSAQSRVFFGAMRRSHESDREEMAEISLGSRLSARAGRGRHGADQRNLKPPLHVDDQEGGERRSLRDEDSTLYDITSGIDSGDTLVERGLPPTDHGMRAYAYLASAFTVELVIWSFPFSYGVFFAHSVSLSSTASTSLSLSPFSSAATSYLLPLTGTLSTGLTYLLSPLALALISRYPTRRRYFVVAGASLCVGSLVGAAFSQETWHFLVAQGLVYPLGASILYRPATSYLPEWFSTRRAMANSVMYCATGLGGIVIPFVSDKLLHTYGHRVTFITLVCPSSSYFYHPFVDKTWPDRR
jgi:hypothetical protein